MSTRQRMQTWRWVPLALLLAMGGAMGRADALRIESFDGTGRLTFQRTNTVEMYCVEWANAPAGIWHRGYPGAGVTRTPGVDGTATATVSIAGAAVTSGFFRVVAATNTYLVVDLSGGTSATIYPVTYLSAVPPGGWTDADKTTRLVMRRVPATSPDFTMGSPTNELGHIGDETQHHVMLTEDFYLGVFEVTQRQWELVMGDKPSYFTNTTYYQTRPVEQVSYHDIRENTNNSAISPNWPQSGQAHTDSFMGKLRAKTGLSGFDLPTEAQWEYACRAGTTTALNSGYDLTSTGSDPRMSEVGRYWHNTSGSFNPDSAPSTGTARAGTYPPNAWGLYDMHGNVWEWCLDWYGIYPGTVTDPKGADYLWPGRIYRGGGFGDNAHSCRSACRTLNYPTARGLALGFRACCVPPGQP